MFINTCNILYDMCVWGDRYKFICLSISIKKFANGRWYSVAYINSHSVCYSKENEHCHRFFVDILIMLDNFYCSAWLVVAYNRGISYALSLYYFILCTLSCLFEEYKSVNT